MSLVESKANLVNLNSGRTGHVTRHQRARGHSVVDGLEEDHRDLLQGELFWQTTHRSMASPWRSGENLASSSRIWDWDNENDGLTDNDTPHTANLPPQAVSQETPFQQLIRHWMNERHSPVILPAQEILLGRLLDHIRKQVRNHVLISSSLRYADLHSLTMFNFCAQILILLKRSISVSCLCKPK